jgi:sporulation protein YlmC with PRC-barrel domain
MKELADFGIKAKDGEIGSVEEVFFDDRHWKLRYLVVKPQKWLSGRKVLISPGALGKPDWKKRVIPTDLTKAQIEKSPDVELHKPSSRQDEEKLIKYYKWEFYWSDPDFYLQSSKDLMGYEIEASDGKIGMVTDFVLDDADWRIRYLIVDTNEWLPGKKVLIAMDWIKLIVPEEKRVRVDLGKSEIEKAPQYDPKALPSRDYENALYKYYGKRRYWI